MFDGAALATGAEVVQDTTTQEQTTPDQDLAGVDPDAEAESSSNPLTDRIDLSSALSSLSSPSERREMIFIDTGVEGYQTLTARELTHGPKPYCWIPPETALNKSQKYLGTVQTLMPFISFHMELKGSCI